jgi:hypothetical protein
VAAEILCSGNAFRTDQHRRLVAAPSLASAALAALRPHTPCTRAAVSVPSSLRGVVDGALVVDDRVGDGIGLSGGLA